MNRLGDMQIEYTTTPLKARSSYVNLINDFIQMPSPYMNITAKGIKEATIVTTQIQRFIRMHNMKCALKVIRCGNIVQVQKI